MRRRVFVAGGVDNWVEAPDILEIVLEIVWHIAVDAKAIISRFN